MVKPSTGRNGWNCILDVNSRKMIAPTIVTKDMTNSMPIKTPNVVRSITELTIDEIIPKRRTNRREPPIKVTDVENLGKNIPDVFEL